jgi:hypothetical protein
MKRAIAVLLVALMVSVLAGVLLVSLAAANPYYHGGYVAPPGNVNPPVITIYSPQNNTAYVTKTVFLSFSVNVGSSPYSTWISRISYRRDLEVDSISVYEDSEGNFYTRKNSMQICCSFQELTEGKHTVKIHATESGAFLVAAEFTTYLFTIDNYLTIDFFVHTIGPNVSVVSLENNRTYSAADIPLFFMVNEPLSKISYSLDGLANVTVSGNTTLTGLSSGQHSLLVHVWDNFGAVGLSETVSFTVEPVTFPVESFSTISIAFVIVAPCAVVFFGLSAYLVRRNKRRRTG